MLRPGIGLLHEFVAMHRICVVPAATSDGLSLCHLCRCIIDNQSRTFDSDSGTMLANFGEMVVRELERDKVLEMQRRASEALSQEKTQLLRAINCFRYSTQADNRASVQHDAQQPPPAPLPVLLPHSPCCCDLFVCSEAIMLCNVSEPTWPMMFVNEAWEKVTGVKRDVAVASGFWDAFKVCLQIACAAPAFPKPVTHSGSHCAMLCRGHR